MYSIDEYHDLAKKYGNFSSWAIWDNKVENNTSIIDGNYKQLHPNFVFLGLNISFPLIENDWINFHSGKHDRKLKYACNDNKLRGSYITDIFKGVAEPKSVEFKKLLTKEIIEENITNFHREMSDIKINENTVFVILGTKNSLTAKYFNDYFKKDLKNKVIYHYHHSYYGMSDKRWVEILWDRVDINQNFEETLKKYQ